MRSIGEMASDSGLSVSALRFYDRAGVFVPAWVDPVSGYRWYGPEQLDESRLLARLRRAAMPLADIRLVLAGWSSADPDLVRNLLQAHLRRLEKGLSEARRELSSVRALLENRENPLTMHSTASIRLAVPVAELAAALDAVRFAASIDPQLPMLGGVLFDIEGDSLHVVATDRYRMALAHVGTTGYGGPRMQVIVPSPLADAMQALLVGGASAARLAVDASRVCLEAGDREAAGQRLGHDFPDYRRFVTSSPARRVLIDVAALRAEVETGPVREEVVREQDGASCNVTVLAVTADSSVTICEGDDDHRDHVAVNREYLLQALAAGGRDQLMLEFGAPNAPLAIRRTDAEDTFSLLMPIRLDS
ncbi:MAG TPA: MerR family transcriptional regulator [Streptosporangiaceae bacterium]|nr:MerR family transcriptional regulator [Streptosporangiaceae bacterium]